MTQQEKHDNQALMTAKRADYIERRISHEDYYLWLSNFIGLEECGFDDARLHRSEDPHFNDIPLGSWEGQDGYVRRLASAKGLPWSICETVCCLKALARQRVKLVGAHA